MSEFQQHRQGCKYYFAPLDVCSCVERNMLDRIEALEARVAAEDKLAEALTAYNRGGAGPLTGWLDVEQALATYEATKETDT